MFLPPHRFSMATGCAPLSPELGILAIVERERERKAERVGGRKGRRKVRIRKKKETKRQKKKRTEKKRRREGKQEKIYLPSRTYSTLTPDE